MASALFDKSTVTQVTCDKYAEELVSAPVRPMDWQGAWSYTVESSDGCWVVQFRSEESPLDQETVDLAKEIHPSLAPYTIRVGSLDNGTISVWKMEKVGGVGFLYLIHDQDIQTKLSTTVVDLAGFYATAWRCPQQLRSERRLALRLECERKLALLAKSSPLSLHTHISQCVAALDDIVQLPWVLTHADLSAMNMLFDRTTGHLNGVVDWVDAEISPFGLDFWGLESILGYECPQGWIWLDDETQQLRALFSSTLSKSISASADQLVLIEKSRKLGLLLRYGFVWENGVMMTEENTANLENFLDSEYRYRSDD